MRKEKFVTIDTHDIQKLIITLIDYKCNSKNFEREDSTVTSEDCTKFLNILADLNRYCYEGNDYTLTLEVHH